jgi:phosphotriesterase-related protein
MPTVETVQGAVDADELGLVLVHEHVRFRDEAVAVEWPGRYDEQLELDAALMAVREARQRGVQTIVDPTAMFGGRDVRFMKRVAEETGVRIVPCTGIYSYDYLPHYFENRDVDVMADHFVEDIERGIQGTEIKAAFLKCAADAAGVTENVEKIHRAVARASLQTGAPIMAHSMPAVGTGPRQLDIFAEEGVDLAQVQIAHCGDSEDVEYIQGLIDRGAYVGLDRYGLEMYLPIEKRNAVAAELLRRGHAEQLMISQDFCASIDWFAPEAAEMFESSGAIRNWSMTLVFDEVVPALRELGAMDDASFATIFTANPRRWLTGDDGRDTPPQAGANSS